MSELWPWLVLAGLGAFHGVNPAMGWLFAVALGLHRGRFGVVLWSLPAIAVGHALSVAIVAGLALAGVAVIEGRWIHAAAGVLLLGWAAFHKIYGHRHRVRVGMTAGQGGLLLWSFLMATAHGAGLMILPALLPLCLSGGSLPAAGAASAVAAVALHSAAMLTVTALIATVVYRWIGLAVLRRAWLNLDVVWTAALAATGLILILQGTAAVGH